MNETHQEVAGLFMVMMSDSFLSDAGWLFFAAWSVVVAAVSITAFGRDLLPSKATVDSVTKSSSAEHAQPRKSALH